MTAERIFIIGGTGNIGKALVDELIAKNIKLTLYARNPAKVNSLFSTGDITIVEGDFDNLDGIKDAVKGHTRLFIVVNDTADVVHIKKTVATYAYEAGVKQIVDISTLTAGYAWKSTSLGEIHAKAERAIEAIPNRGRFVALRPGRFMSNILLFDRVHPDGVLRDIYEPDQYLGWISPNDIAAVAAAILTEDIEKHKDSAYELVGDRVTPNQRAEMMSRILNKKITYQQVPVVDKYKELISYNMPHDLVFYITCHPATAPPEGIVTDYFHVLIGRGAETLEEFAIKNKEAL